MRVKNQDASRKYNTARKPPQRSPAPEALPPAMIVRQAHFQATAIKLRRSTANIPRATPQAGERDATGQPGALCRITGRKILCVGIGSENIALERVRNSSRFFDFAFSPCFIDVPWGRACCDSAYEILRIGIRCAPPPDDSGDAHVARGIHHAALYGKGAGASRRSFRCCSRLLFGAMLVAGN